MSIDLKGWLKQPTTIHGIAGIAALAAGGAVYFVTRDAAMASMAGGSAGSAVCMALNDNSADKSSIEKLVTDGINAVVAKHVSEMLPTLGDDMRHVLVPSLTGQPSVQPMHAVSLSNPGQQSAMNATAAQQPPGWQSQPIHQP